MYAKCGSLEDAHRVFDLMPCHSVVSWNSLILGYVQSGEGSLALLVFSEMQRRGCAPNALTYTAALKACSSVAANDEGKLLKLKNLEKGRALHWQATKAGLDSDLLLGSTLIDMYAKCGSLVDASRVFDRMQRKTAVSWNALLLGYAENGEGHLALELFSRMETEGFAPDSRTYVAALKACAGLTGKETGSPVGGQVVKISSLEKVMAIHSRARNRGYDTDIYVQNTLVDAYAKCGSMWDARGVFDRMLYRGVVSWTALILGYVEAGEEQLGLELFEQMKDHGGQPNARTIVAAVKACTGLATQETGQKVEGRRKLVKSEALNRGFQIHAEASASLCDVDSFVASSLVNMYATCGSLADARSVFDKIRKPDTVLWNVLMLGYVDNGEAELALHFYSSVMGHTGCQPDASTFVTALKACAALADAKAAKAVHGDIVRQHGLDRNGEILLNSLVDVYGKCGSMIEAQQAFDLIPTEDLQVGAWNALLVGFGRQGDVKQVFKVFQIMQDESFKADGITLNCVLTGCSHAGLVERGREFFQSMEHTFGIPPDVEHYTCVVDMLGRANKLTAALEVVKSIPTRVDAVIWMTLLTSCWKWRNLAIGRVAFDAVLQLGNNEKIDAAYNLMANLCWSAQANEARCP
ncbi:pentatricopeptide repeat-containing protein At3g12770 isoform X1 [Selaginella moellendorffii]|uniref:pentatricopeptide repeat-containing protein At3g12770 isoform X1 n=2 Tax=Selaginella moellendorffii TaxID=88036 RepID=UPI000D1CD10E|nr:pentatricopeptide repeat-containing protein At3g12770 isoform X1 [Selaginella moellendorffii]XP_024535796.1 pentatricopeptide repeat-containing protein At3g12770 isoform X1 [Selaginella moellendorffii]XP_024535797.1 pentatricopeptide repeat-containing protein At3g12770 isoform X1 [Selaginella moellendorffii]|eukprot:XP_024535795.1 pentatricopeptide repeat-containing protein At3g12770 isoform X1 [Selaginella moellendorffii]